MLACWHPPPAAQNSHITPSIPVQPFPLQKLCPRWWAMPGSLVCQNVNCDVSSSVNAVPLARPCEPGSPLRMASGLNQTLPRLHLPKPPKMPAKGPSTGRIQLLLRADDVRDNSREAHLEQKQPDGMDTAYAPSILSSPNGLSGLGVEPRNPIYREDPLRTLLDGIG